LTERRGSSWSVFGDGACSGNPGPGGWGTIVVPPDGKPVELHGGEVRTTNNRMELMAVLKGLSRVPSDAQVEVTSDSQYVVRGASSWLASWKRKGWKTSTGGLVSNQDLWESIDAEKDRLVLSWNWVNGHAGHPQNERCDQLARQGAREAVLEAAEAPAPRGQAAPGRHR